MSKINWLKIVVLLIKNLKNISTMKNLKDWKTTLPAIALFISQFVGSLGIEIPENVSSIIVVIAVAILTIVKGEPISLKK